MSAHTTQELADGMIVGGYRLDALLGSGGMGVVYRARPVDGGEDVAIKILLKEHVGDPGVVARFLREARAARVVDHPNVVRVLDIGRDADDRPFIVQELLRGEDLSKLLKVTRKISPALALELLIPVVEAMAYAHERGVVHRDLKPGNIFITFVDGKRTPRVLDFGISHLIGGDDGTRLTSTGMSLGTPAYMAPEQVMASKEIDARADVWSLGVILYQVVAGRLPFAKAESAGALYVQICTTEAPPLEKTVPGVPRDYARIVARCLRPDRKDRYPSAAELLEDLCRLRDDRPIGPGARAVKTSMDRVLIEEPAASRGPSMPSDMPTQGLSTEPVALPRWSGPAGVEPMQLAYAAAPRSQPRMALLTTPTPGAVEPEQAALPEASIPPPPPLGPGVLDVALGTTAWAAVVLLPWPPGPPAFGPMHSLPHLVTLGLALALAATAAVRGVRRGQFSKAFTLASTGFLALALTAGVQAFAAADFPALPGQVTPWATLVAVAGCAGIGVGEIRKTRESHPARWALAAGAFVLVAASLGAAWLVGARIVASAGLTPE